MFQLMAARLDALLALASPRRLLLVAIDGVAPRAKLVQQRTRRFLKAHVSSIESPIEAEV